MPNSITLLKRLLTPYDVGQPKIRIGPPYDGGYVFDALSLIGIDAVYSLGIGRECGCDLVFAEHGIPVWMFEAKYDKPPQKHELFYFEYVFITGELLEKRIASNGHEKANLLLALDADRSEYDIIQGLSDATIRLFSQMSIEVQNVLTDRRAPEVFERINQTHCLIHIHANNCCRFDPKRFIRDGVADVIELTYLRRDCFSATPQVWTCASPIDGLDYRNLPSHDPVPLDWWIQS